jgi:hypothetical protein
MDAMNLPANSKTEFSSLLLRLQNDFLEIKFEPAEAFRWSFENQTVYYTADSEYAGWSLLHEVGHMVNRHSTYHTDTMLIRMEAEAWQTASDLASRYGEKIDEDYIQDCIDSYRNWQYQRSKCPVCEQTGVEKADGHYKCINCGKDWKVTVNRFCRVYRKTQK